MPKYINMCVGEKTEKPDRGLALLLAGVVVGDLRGLHAVDDGAE